jgi:hypothetical protein
MKRVFLSALYLSVGLTFGAAPATARELTLPEAQHLVETYLASNGTTALQLPGFSYDFAGRLKTHHRFYGFNAVWSNPGPGSVVVGFYYVDSETADVWDGLLCEATASTPALRTMQKRLRQKIGMQRANYLRVRYKGDVCGIG